MNENLIKMLNDMAAYEDFLGRQWPAKAYRTAVKTISGLTEEVTDVEQVKDLPGIGSGIAKKIESWLKEGTFDRYQEFLASDANAVKEMAAVKGVGMAKAKKLLENGINSVEALKKAVAGKNVGDKIMGTKEPITITATMKAGLEYDAHSDKTRMSMEEHDRITGPMIDAIRRQPEVVEVSAAGSARRYDGSESYTVGDVDLIIAIKREPSQKLLKMLEGELDEVVMSGKTKISGIRGRRQVDIRIVPEEDYSALLLHATGPMSFNVRCRKAAIKRGWKLSEYGLVDAKTGKVISRDENDILVKLGIGWVDPKDRK